jgi:hypothetical protein
MSKHIDPDYLYKLPSGSSVHPCRLIHKDGTLMWKHAFYTCNNVTYLPSAESQEQHIIKTAQRLEELNSWVSQDLEPWQSLIPFAWYSPFDPELQDGISVYFQHALYDTEDIYSQLLPHVQEHETLEQRKNLLIFKRC